MSSTYSNSTTWSDLNGSKTQLLSLGNDQYRYFHKDWLQLLDTAEGGEREVKERGEEYLPKTSGMKANTTSGDEVYEAYKLRAIFYEYTKDTIPAMLGVMHSKPAKIEIPDSIAHLNEESDSPESWRVGLQQVLREINNNQLTYGRYGLLTDIPAKETAASEVRPYIQAYESFYILDWSERELEDGSIIIDYVLLAEHDPDSTDRTARYEEPKMRLRILALDENGDYYYVIISLDDGPDTVNDTLKGIDLDNPPEQPEGGGFGAVYPEAMNQRLKFIPFVFINVTNLLPDVEKSPLLPLSDMDISIYRGDADWAQAYFLQGQATLVASGVSEGEEVFVGAGNMIKLSDKDAKVQYAEVSGAGLGEMRERQTGLQNYATSIGVSLVDQNQAESGTALEMRSSIKSAPLSTIAAVGAKGLTQALRYANYWKTGEFGQDKVLISPNQDFTSSTKAAKELVDLFNAKLAGAPISMRDVHKWARDNNFSNKTFEDTLTDIGEEE